MGVFCKLAAAAPLFFTPVFFSVPSADPDQGSRSLLRSYSSDSHSVQVRGSRRAASWAPTLVCQPAHNISRVVHSCGREHRPGKGLHRLHGTSECAQTPFAVPAAPGGPAPVLLCKQGGQIGEMRRHLGLAA